MLEFIFVEQNLPFTISIAVMLLIAILEVIGAIIGTGLSSLVDQLVPDADIDIGIEGPDLDAPGLFAKNLSWLNFKRVPVLVLLVVFLLLFGISGLCLQHFISTEYGFMLTPLIASALAFVITLPMLKITTSLLSSILPKDETNAVSLNSLIGRTAQITLGTAKPQYPTRAKVRDQFGKIHYLMLEPEKAEEVFKKGDLVVLARHDGVRFFAIRKDIQKTLNNI